MASSMQRPSSSLVPHLGECTYTYAHERPQASKKPEAPPSPWQHPYDHKAPVKPSLRMPGQRRKGGFGTNGGTIPGMGTPQPHPFNGTLRRK